jgi:alpha-tubulin suppressor-like RCC1 family protein
MIAMSWGETMIRHRIVRRRVGIAGACCAALAAGLLSGCGGAPSALVPAGSPAGSAAASSAAIPSPAGPSSATDTGSATPATPAATAHPAAADLGSGQVWAWGGLGDEDDPTSAALSLPVRIGQLRDVTDIALAGYKTYFLEKDGTVWQWSTTPGARQALAAPSTPTPVAGIGGVASLVAVGDQSYGVVALKHDGTVWTWRVPDTQAVDGAGQVPSAPAAVAGLTGVTSLAVADEEGTVALVKDDGTVWTWGTDDTVTGSAAAFDGIRPVQVAGLTDVARLEGEDAAFAVKHDGSVWNWCADRSGCWTYRAPIAKKGAQTKPPVVNGAVVPLVTRVPGLNDPVAIHDPGGYGGAVAYAVAKDGTVWAWGDNDWGQLGDGTQTYRTVPTRVSGLTGVTKLVAFDTGYDGWGGTSAMAVTKKGDVWVWGNDDWGLFSGRETTYDANPKRTGILSPRRLASLSGVTNLVAFVGDLSVESPTLFAIHADGTVSAWGGDLDGQLADGGGKDTRKPAAVASLAGVSRIVPDQGLNVVFAVQ